MEQKNNTIPSEEDSKEISDKIIANAISAYFMVFISGLFLFNKENKLINNKFVREHTKTALLIHSLFFLTYLLFVRFDLGQSIFIPWFGFSLNNILSSTIFIALFIVLLFGCYRAYLGKSFTIYEIKEIGIKKKVIDINGDSKMNEKDKLTFILAYIPFIGNIIYSKYKKNEIIQKINKLNLISTLIILLFYIFGNYSIANLLSLFYIIFAVFSSINIILSSQIISLNLNFIHSFEQLETFIKSFKKYLINYFTEKKFIPLKEIIKNETEKQILEEKENLEILNTTPENLKIFSKHKYLIYIPFINLAFIYFKKSKYKFHIINGVTITGILSILLILGYFGLVNTKFNILFLLPIFYGIGYLKTKLAYKMPFIYDIFEISNYIFSKIMGGFSFLKKKHSEDNKGSLKPSPNLYQRERDNKENKI